MKDTSQNIFSFLQRAMKDNSINPIEFKILSCITFLNGYDIIFPSLDYISKATGVKSKPDISKYLNKLQKLDYIKIQRQQRKSNIYKLNFDKSNPGDELKEIINNDIYDLLLSEFKKIGFNKLYLDSLLKSNKEKIEAYKKYIMLLYVIQKVLKYDPDNLKAYLKKSFQSQEYSEYHSEVFNNNIKSNNKISNNGNRKIIEQKPKRVFRNIQAMREILNKV